MVKIISDSTCDLSKELLEKYDIAIIPLHIHLGEEEYEDGKNIFPDEIYRWSDANNTTPKTAAVSINEVIEKVGPYLNEGKEVVYFSISSDMSVSYQVACMAREELENGEKMEVIDSRNLSTGIGLQVIEAAIMAKEGKSAGEIAAHIRKMQEKVRASFVVDTLTYLHRGGRCSAVAAMAGGMLKLHPSIVVEHGKMHPDKKYRGKLSKVILDYTKDMEESMLHAKKDRVFITHSGCEDAVIESVKEYLESLHHFDEILVTRAGGVISSHCGPGTLGVLFIAE